MNTNVNFPAPLGVIGHLGASFVMVALALVVIGHENSPLHKKTEFKL